MKTYEIFTEDGSKIIQAKNMASAIGKHGLVSGNIDKELIAIIEVERGQDFLTSDKQLPIHSVSDCVFSNMDDDGFTLSIHKTEDGAKKDRDKRRENGEDVESYQVDLLD
jgi:hypothetical protein